MLLRIFEFIQKNISALTLISVICSGIWAIYKFRKYSDDKRFEIYHKLIKELVDETENPDKKIKIDRQTAIVFELRHFPKYFFVMKRILLGLRDDWKKGDERIIKEIDLTLKYIKQSCVKRFLNIYHE